MFMTKQSEAEVLRIIEEQGLDDKVIALFQEGPGITEGCVIVQIRGGEIYGHKCIPMSEVEYRERLQAVALDMQSRGKPVELVPDEGNGGGLH